MQQMARWVRLMCHTDRPFAVPLSVHIAIAREMRPSEQNESIILLSVPFVKRFLGGFQNLFHIAKVLIISEPIAFI